MTAQDGTTGEVGSNNGERLASTERDTGEPGTIGTTTAGATQGRATTAGTTTGGTASDGTRTVGTAPGETTAVGATTGGMGAGGMTTVKTHTGGTATGGTAAVGATSSSSGANGAAPARPEPAATGAAAGYRADRTLSVRVELARQFRRKRTQISLGFLVVLPFLLLIAFKVGNGSSNRNSGQLADLATVSGPNFVVFALFASASFLLVVVVALFFGDTVASEASWSSLKYLLAVPVPRGRLLRQKAIVSGILTLLGLVLLPAVSLLVGVLWYGSGDMVGLTGDALPFATAIGRIALAVGYLAVHLLWVAGLALLLSVSTDAPLGAVGGAVLVSILSEILDSITALGGLREYLPTHYAYAWADLLSTDIDWANIARGALSALVYGVIFLALAGRRFATKDVTS